MPTPHPFNPVLSSAPRDRLIRLSAAASPGAFHALRLCFEPGPVFLWRPDVTKFRHLVRSGILPGTLGKDDVPPCAPAPGAAGNRPIRLWLALLSLLLVTTPGCTTLKRAAVNQAGNALAGGGNTFASDNDPELIREAVPFSLKLMESLLAESPRHAGLLLGLASGFTQYAYAFVQQDADLLHENDFTAAEADRARAKRHYLRARDYGLRGLETAHPGFGAALAAGTSDAVVLGRSDVPQLYWTAAAWGAAIALGKDDPALLVEIPRMESLIDRALKLDETWNHGAIHSFLIGYEMSRPGDSANAPARARAHFQRAVELSGGREAGPYVTLAESVSVQTQDAREFDAMLARALAINPDAEPGSRLVNLITQRRARWLLARKDDLFLPARNSKNP